MKKATIVPKEHIADVWEDIEEYVKNCAKYTYGRFTEQDILRDVLLKDQQLWVSFDTETKVIVGFLESLEEDDDVQNVYSNVKFKD